MAANRLRELRERAGLSMQALAERVGTSAPQINKLEKGERRMTIDWLARLAKGLGVDLRDLLIDPPVAPEAQARMLPALSAVAGAGILPGGEAALLAAPLAQPDPRDLIPVRSAARGGDQQEMFLADGPIDFTRRPHSLLHVREAYAIYMLGDSMNPRFRQGQLLHVNPYKPPAPGAGVVVTRRDNAVLIKEFVRRANGILYLRQYNPEGPIEFALAEVRDVHTVVGLDEP